MKKNRLKIIIITSVISLTIILGVVLANSFSGNKLLKKFYNGLPVEYSLASYMYDTATPEKAIGISDYVFIAKVNEIARTEYKYPVEAEISLNKKIKRTTPYTIYNISVIKNIKGELVTSKPIEFMQYGGLSEDGKSYSLIEEGSLLKTGEYYIIMGNTFEKDGGIVEVSEPTRIIPLGKDTDFNKRDSVNIVTKYEQAYKNEVVPSKEKGNLVEYKKGYISKYDVNYEE